MNRSFFDLPQERRFAVYKAIENAQCAHHAGGSFGLSVAVGKGQFSALVEAMQQFGFQHADLYTFPLGTDKPPAHLRHDNRGFPDSCWLIATFTIPKADHADLT
jgi:hypothetical protein